MLIYLLNSPLCYWRVTWVLPNDLCQTPQVGINSQTICLCQKVEKSVRHLFCNCEYTRKILSDIVPLGHSFWKISNSPIPTTLHIDIRIGDLTEACQKFTHHSTCWGALEHIGQSILTHLAERNRRLRTIQLDLQKWLGNYQGLQSVLQAGVSQEGKFQA